MLSTERSDPNIILRNWRASFFQLCANACIRLRGPKLDGQNAALPAKSFDRGGIFTGSARVEGAKEKFTDYGRGKNGL